MKRRCALKNIENGLLKDWLQQKGYRTFRAEQMLHWMYKRWALSAGEMQNIPADLRSQLDGSFYVFSLNCIETYRAEDGTCKYVLQTVDDLCVETVLMYAENRLTVCVSSQVGCPVGCRFCASGRHGLVRNLSKAEIVDQVVYACRQAGRKVDNIVLMGMGEPLLNTANVIGALNTINDVEKVGCSARGVTVSTSGVVPGIYELGGAERQWNLAVSLHAADEESRARIIPDAYRYDLEAVFEACRWYRQKSSRMVTFEYTVVSGLNDRRIDLEKLAENAKAIRAKVNLIAANPLESEGGRDHTKAARDASRFLQGRGVRVTLRRSRGQQIRAACGQLARTKPGEDNGEAG